VDKASQDPRQADVRLNWGSLDTETLTAIMPVLKDGWKNGGITTLKLRAILRDVLHLEKIAE